TLTVLLASGPAAGGVPAVDPLCPVSSEQAPRGVARAVASAAARKPARVISRLLGGSFASLPRRVAWADDAPGVPRRPLPLCGPPRAARGARGRRRRPRQRRARLRPDRLRRRERSSPRAVPRERPHTALDPEGA